MDFFKATNGIHWYISIDGGETFEFCPREPILGDKLNVAMDEIPLLDSVGSPEELTLTRDQLEERGFTISRLSNG